MRPFVLTLTLAGCGGALVAPSPRVLSATPAGVGAAPDVWITLGFSEPMAPDGLLDGRFVALAPSSLAGKLGGWAADREGVPPGAPVVLTRASLSADGRWVSLRPLGPLAPRTDHVVIVSRWARSRAGKTLVDGTGKAGPFVGAFRTGDLRDGTPPALVASEPPAGTALPRNWVRLRARFDEAVTGALVLGDEAGARYSPTWPVDPATLEAARPVGEAMEGTLHVALAKVRDAAGNAARGELSFPIAGCADERAPDWLEPPRVEADDRGARLAVVADEPGWIEAVIEGGCGGPAVATGFARCLGFDPCGREPGRCEATLEAGGLCPGADHRARIGMADLAGHTSRIIELRFRTAPPHPRPVVTEVLAAAASPESGGEFIEIANLGSGGVDLVGWTLAKTSRAGTVRSCALEALRGGPLEAGAVALAVGGAWDDRYPLPAGVPLYQCGGGALLGGLSDSEAPSLSLEDPEGHAVSTLGAAGGALCDKGQSLARRDPSSPDEAAQLACDVPTPGAIPSSHE